MTIETWLVTSLNTKSKKIIKLKSDWRRSFQCCQYCKCWALLGTCAKFLYIGHNSKSYCLLACRQMKYFIKEYIQSTCSSRTVTNDVKLMVLWLISDFNRLQIQYATIVVKEVWRVRISHTNYVEVYGTIRVGLQIRQNHIECSNVTFHKSKTN